MALEQRAVDDGGVFQVSGKAMVRRNTVINRYHFNLSLMGSDCGLHDHSFTIYKGAAMDVHQDPILMSGCNALGSYHCDPCPVHGGAFNRDRAERENHVLHHLHHPVHFGDILAPPPLVVRGWILVG
jgi:hypothetical protein